MSSRALNAAVKGARRSKNSARCLCSRRSIHSSTVPDPLPAQDVPPSYAAAESSQRPLTYSPPVVRPPTKNTSPSLYTLVHTLHTPPPVSSVAALAARLELTVEHDLSDSGGKARLSLETVEKCCISPTFWTAADNARGISRPSPSQTATLISPPSKLSSGASKTTSGGLPYTNFHDATQGHNGPLSTLGNSILGMLAAEDLGNRYPHLPSRVLKALVTQYVGPATCAEITRSWGVGPALSSAVGGPELALGQVPPSRTGKDGWKGRGSTGSGLLRWFREESSGERQTILFEDAMASVAKAFVGAIFSEFGFPAARQFVRAHFLSRRADPSSLLKFKNPKHVLGVTIKKYGREATTSRLLKETGRASLSPVFVVGVFSGTVKLGEGFGSSIKMAEYRACEDALRRIYLSKGFSSLSISGDRDRTLPTDTLISPDFAYTPLPLGDNEVMDESASRVGSGPGNDIGRANGPEKLVEEALLTKTAAQRRRAGSRVLSR